MILGAVILALVALIVWLLWSRRRTENREARRLEAETARHRAEIDAARDDLREERAVLGRREATLSEREDHLRREVGQLDERSGTLDRLHADLVVRTEAVAAAESEAMATLERVSNLSHDDAVAQVLARAEHEARLRAAALARDIEAEARQNADREARWIITSAIQRLASEQTTESVLSAVDLPTDDLKGRIIGREGRNIRTFEQITGVNVLIDDTPGIVLISSFDPVRREVARLTLAELVVDGRIQPARIEEIYEKSKATIAERIAKAAQDALDEVGITDLHPDLLPYVGALRYRTSYGQNVLAHLVECAHLAGLMAAELRLDVARCKRAAFLHDIGKALTHEAEGSHAIVGADLARRYGEDPDIVNAIEAHHNEVEPLTVEAVLTQAADAISGSRPGARRESLEAYVKRLERLERIALAHEGVERAFAMQAGREVRVMVTPELVDDAESSVIAGAIAREIERELTYPGQIRVTVVRESRATDVAK
jgi:ribonuclease Y